MMNNIKQARFQDTIDSDRSVANNSSQDTFSLPAVSALQKKAKVNEGLQLKSTAQLTPEEDELQMKSANVVSEVSQRKDNGAPLETNHTGMPDQLKSGIENLSGFSMDDVKVHYNSAKPAQLNALAYAQGTDIHIAPGQERHLPHEAWHVVQQKQGRVRPTMQMKGTVINDDTGLEKEADVMGGRAVGNSPFQTYYARSQEFHSSSFVLQKTKDEHETGDLHYGIHVSRINGYEDMPEATIGAKNQIDEDNPVTVDELNSFSGITKTFESGSNRMEGYFNVMEMLKQHVPNSRADKVGRWLDFLKANLNYLSIQKHADQLGGGNYSLAHPTKDRLAKNGSPSSDELGRAATIYMDYYLKGHSYKSPEEVDQVNQWTWDVFFRKTSKLGIDFTIQEGKVIHMNTYVPPSIRRGVAESRLTTDTANPQRSRQPITHSELRYINRKYRINHSQIDMYYKSPSGNIERAPDEGKIS